jgi:hypothetical protein
MLLILFWPDEDGTERLRQGQRVFVEATRVETTATGAAILAAVEAFVAYQPEELIHAAAGAVTTARAAASFAAPAWPRR